MYDEQKIVNVNIEKEMKKSYIDYAMSVIVGRALPDVRDGLKPVHRRILYAMYEANLTNDRPYRKAAATIGDVLAKYHPHGDSSVYDALVRLAQDFSMRMPMVDGRGNFGSVDGDPPAAYRYTEARLAKIAREMLVDIEKETVDFAPNFEDRIDEPTVLPSRIPNLLVNGSMGIAVGMATNIPPHNLGEVIDGIVEVIDNPETTTEDIMNHIKGPDFPTGGIIMGRSGIRDYFNTGRGRVIVRSVAEIEEYKDGRYRIVVTEIPFQVNKARLVENIARLITEKKIEGISAIRDESDRTGMKIIIEIKKDANAQVVLNQLYKHTQLQESFSVIMLALVNNEPKVLAIREVLDNYINFQKDVLLRRTTFELRKAKEKEHILQGLKIALDFVDEVIAIIRSSRDVSEYKEKIMPRFDLSEIQAQAIWDMRLGRLSGLEREKIEQDLAEILEQIKYFNEILSSDSLVYTILKEDLIKIKEKYKDERRTQISNVIEDIDDEDLIEESECVYTMTHFGYIKRQQKSAYRSQRRGGKGLSSITTREEDFVETISISSTHAYILFFTSKGRLHRIKGYRIPEASRHAKGINIVNLLPIDSDEKVTAMIPVREFEEGKYLTMITKYGTVKRTRLEELDSSRKSGIFAITLDEGDELINVNLTDSDCEIIIGTLKGKAIRFKEEDARSMGRNARGVRGIRLSKGDYVIGASIVKEGEDLLTVTENGFGKRTDIAEYKVQQRGGKGISNYNITDKTGNVAGIKIVDENDDVMIITDSGTIIRTGVESISKFRRVAQGVILMRLGENIKVVNIARAQKEDEDEMSQEDLPDDEE